jgi:predicted RNA-binding protein Jag
MADATVAAEATTAADTPAEHPAVTPAPAARKQQVQTVLADILRLMAYPATLEFKDMPDGGIGVAVYFDGELPGITPGKRSYLVDCLQFLVNKSLNRPNVERRWVSLGVNAFPEPRGSRPPPADKPAPEAAKEPRASAPQGRKGRDGRDGRDAKKTESKGDGKGKQGGRPPAPPSSTEVNEATLAVEEDPALTRVATSLAEKSARLGRPFALVMLSTEDRARVLAATKGLPGVHARAEGKKHLRRVSILPDKPAPMPRRHFMADDDEEE